MVKNLPASAADLRDTGSTPWVRKMLLEVGIAIHSGILAWRIPWTEEPDGLQSIGLQKVRHDRATKHTHTVVTTRYNPLGGSNASVPTLHLKF